MEEGTFSAWLKRDGDRVRSGDRLFVLESEKATEEIETLDSGILRIPADAPKPGESVTVGQVLGYLAADGETAPATCGPVPAREAKTSHVGSERSGRTPPEQRVVSPVAGDTGSSAASPRARRVARELGVDWRNLRGSGATGRIRERDVRDFAGAGGRSPEKGRLIPHTRLRRTIAARMVAGVTQAAPVTLTTRIDATALVALRQQFKKSAHPGDAVPTYADMALVQAAAALRQHPMLQAQWREDGLFLPERVDIALAVDTEAGLLVAVIRDADKLSLVEVASRSTALIAQARAGTLKAEQMRDATFTISNLGGLGVDAFTPIIHVPQCAVLGLGRITREPAVVDDRIVPRDRMTLSLTFDHRIVDGAPAARFLQTLREHLELLEHYPSKPQGESSNPGVQ
jgi:pyruvate dehydrogenase E2 component (dihydrolipoamide acetyltransferase)